MKKLSIYITIITLLFTACVGEEDDLFNKPSAERLNEAVAEYTQTFQSAANGWIMEYFPTVDQQGYTFLMKFGNGDVTMAARNSFTNNEYMSEVSLWEILADNGPLLSFNSYNNLFHMFATPEDLPDTEENEQGMGYMGDYEFIVMKKVDDNKVLLKGKKRGVYINLRQLDANYNWEDYFDKLVEIDNTIFNSKIDIPLTFTQGEAVYDLTGGNSHIFLATPQGGDPITDGIEVPFIITDYGIKLSEPFIVDGIELESFKLSEDKNSLISQENSTSIITGPDPIGFYHEAIDDKSLRWTLLYEENTMSPLVKEVYEKVVASFEAVNMTLGQVSYLYTNRNETHAVYIANTRGTGGYIYFDKEPISQGVKYDFKGQFDNNGRTFYNNYNGVSELIDLLDGSFTISNAYSSLNPSKLKLENTQNSDIWFFVTTQ